MKKKKIKQSQPKWEKVDSGVKPREIPLARVKKLVKKNPKMFSSASLEYWTK